MDKEPSIVMASNSHNNNNNNSNKENSYSSWTRMQNKQFESALALYDQDTPDRWQNIAKVVGDKSVEEVKRHYEILLEDLSHIESGRVPIPTYKSTDKNQERPSSMLISIEFMNSTQVSSATHEHMNAKD